MMLEGDAKLVVDAVKKHVLGGLKDRQIGYVQRDVNQAVLMCLQRTSSLSQNVSEGSYCLIYIYLNEIVKMNK